MNARSLVIYHAGCRDGFAAAWAVRRGLANMATRAAHAPTLPQADFHAAHYGTQPPDVSGRDVIMVDFSYPRPEMEAIVRDSASLLVLDHHKTAEEALRGLANLAPEGKVDVHFDMERSGAGMAWDHFFKGVRRPWLIDYVEDRDLWRKALPNTEEIGAYIGTLPFDFDEWDAQSLRSRALLDSVIERGDAVVRKIRQYVNEVLKNKILFLFCDFVVPLVNCPQVDISETLAELARRPLDLQTGALPPFAMGWWQRHDGRFQYSLRSAGSFDVSVLAKRYGGGGHQNAAGFEAAKPIHF